MSEFKFKVGDHVINRSRFHHAVTAAVYAFVLFLRRGGSGRHHDRPLELSSRHRRRFQRGSLQKRRSAGCWNWIAFWWQDRRRRGQILGPCSTMIRPEALAGNGHTASARQHPCRRADLPHLDCCGMDSRHVSPVVPPEMETSTASTTGRTSTSRQ